MEEVREKIANAVFAALNEDDKCGGGYVSGPVNEATIDLTDFDLGFAADRILAIPEIAEGLEFVRFKQSVPKADYSSARQTNNLGHSISTNPLK